MLIFDIINKKKNKQVLSQQEIDFAVTGYQTGAFGDGEMAALLMAICLNGLNRAETSALTMAMSNSGEILDLSDLGIAVDKHSTGGVGDKLTLVVVPMVAAAGLIMSKMSGKSLGHTGGTIDKLTSLPGFKTELSPDAFKSILKSTGAVIASQSANLAPADKVIYTLRDKTACVDDISLIAASVMSKKIAAGAQVIVLDVKVGSGAFMKSLDEARKLAQIMVDIGKDCGRKISAVITSMDAPLGQAVGNSLEVVEAIEVLKGAGDKEIRALSIELAAQIFMLAKCVDKEGYFDTNGVSINEARGMAARTLDDGTAYAKFLEMVQAQGGDVSYAKNPDTLEKASLITPLFSIETGYISRIDGEICGRAAIVCKTNESDTVAGIIFAKKPGDQVKTGEPLAYIHSNCKNATDQTKILLQTAYTISTSKPTLPPLVYEIIS